MEAEFSDQKAEMSGIFVTTSEASIYPDTITPGLKLIM